MLIESKLLGSFEVEQALVYTFSNGIPGFESEKRFVIVQPDPSLPFSYLQSVVHSEIALLLTNPFLFYPNYEFELNEQTQEELEVTDRADVAVWCTVTVSGKLEDATLNLLAPIVVNMKSMLGRQYILHNTDYRTKHSLIPSQAGGDEHARARS